MDSILPTPAEQLALRIIYHRDQAVYLKRTLDYIALLENRLSQMEQELRSCSVIGHEFFHDGPHRLVCSKCGVVDYDNNE